MLKPPARHPSKRKSPAAERVVTAKRPNHLWHVDLTLVPTAGGFWVSWCPFPIAQRWPFCWWVAVVVDHFSRRALGTATFKKEPTAADVEKALDRTRSSPWHSAPASASRRSSGAMSAVEGGSSGLLRWRRV